MVLRHDGFCAQRYRGKNTALTLRHSGANVLDFKGGDFHADNIGRADPQSGHFLGVTRPPFDANET